MSDPDLARSLPISETFISRQGEGLLTGTPSLFIRTSGCNLRCAWCDTPYASWHPERAQRTLASLLDEARAARDQGVQHAVITGGEPLMFAAVGPLTRTLHDEGLHVTIETAGTLVIPGLRADLMSISPKLASSTPTLAHAAAGKIDPAWGGAGGRHDQRRFNLSALQQLLDDHPAPHRQIKFVFTSDADLPEIEALLARLHRVASTDVHLMPEGVATPDPATAAHVQTLCAARGWHFCPRMHLEWYGNKRGT